MSDQLYGFDEKSARRTVSGIRIAEALSRQYEADRARFIPAMDRGSLVPARVMSFVVHSVNRWRYTCKPTTWNFDTNNFNPPAVDAPELECWNLREAHNDGTGQEGEGVTVGVAGAATVGLVPIMIGCHVFLFPTTRKPTKAKADTSIGAIDPGEPAPPLPATTVYLFEAPNAVSVTCGTP